MKKPIITLKTENSLDTSMENLKRYNQAKNLFVTGFSNYSVGQKFTESLEKLRIQNSDFRNCTFVAPVVRTNVSGSYLSNCIFQSVLIENSNMQYSTFDRCKLNTCQIHGSNLSNCYMSGVTMNNNTFIGGNFFRTQFIDCHFSGGEILSSTLEFAEFQNTTFENMRLSNLSMEYSEFKDVHMNNVVLPFAQLPYIFGALEYVFSTRDRISISADIGKIQSISVDEYRGTLEDWKNFLYHKEMYFPLANILLVQNRTEEALEVILAGILYNINHHDYRMLKYMCKLAATHQNVSRDQCKKLYSRIKELILSDSLNEEQNYKYLVHVDDIRNILLDHPKGEAQLSLSLQTSMVSGSEKQLYRIIEDLECILEQPVFNLTSKKITIRHDSPYEIIIIAIGTLYVLKKITDLISKIVHNVKVTADDVKSIYEMTQKQTENDKICRQTKEMMLEKEKLEVQKLRLQISALEHDIKKSGESIKITHNINETDKIYIA